LEYQQNARESRLLNDNNGEALSFPIGGNKRNLMPNPIGVGLLAGSISYGYKARIMLTILYWLYYIENFKLTI
jgi:hypothetical protein